jgi:hypothetical protein
MAETREVHQLEYRWQKVTDMAPIASSMSAESARPWIQRIGVWVRHPSVDVPTESLRYEEFGNGMAALAWRIRDWQGLKSADTRGGLLVISRVLVGPADLLTPEVAAAVCYAGLPEATGPQPGTVAEGTVLPPVPAEALTELVEDTAAVLDEAAVGHDGLDLVLAAALSDQDTALCLQLPERDITRSPRGNSQAALLWGLRRTVWPVVGRGGRRGWSFSTFEPPPSDMDPGALPDIVFRMAQAAQTAPQAMRRELRVRPQDPVRARAQTLPQHLAALLVDAYAEFGGDELGRRIIRAAVGKTTPEVRITAVYDAFDARSPAVTIIGDNQPHGARPNITHAAPAEPSPRPSPGLDPERPFADPPRAPAAPRTAPEPTLAAAPSAPAAPRPAPRCPPTPDPRTETTPWPPAAPPPTSPAGPPPPRPDLSSARSQHEAPSLFADHAHHDQAEARPRPDTLQSESHQPDTLSGLLAILAQGPGHRGWEPTLQALRATNFQSTPDDRAIARRRLADHGWYADVLRQQDGVQAHDLLVMVFCHAVIPDLPDPRVAAELFSWVAEREAPEAVIKALYAAAIGSPHLINRSIGPALATRWRAEHGIHVRSAPRHAAESAPAGSDVAAGDRGPSQDGRGPAISHEQQSPDDLVQRLQNLMDRSVTVPVPLVLAIVIVLVVVFLATR